MEKDTDKKEQGRNAASWGTLNWIATWPWSRMDRKRRKRAERAVGPEFMADFNKGPYTCCVANRIAAMTSKYGVALPAKVQNKLEKALLTVNDIEHQIYDEVFGRALATAWGVER